MKLKAATSCPPAQKRTAEGLGLQDSPGRDLFSEQLGRIDSSLAGAPPLSR
jgi:hypothetical protein